MMTIRGGNTDYPGGCRVQRAAEEKSGGQELHAGRYCVSPGIALNFKVHICKLGITPFHMYLSDYCKDQVR